MAYLKCSDLNLVLFSSVHIEFMQDSNLGLGCKRTWEGEREGDNGAIIHACFQYIFKNGVSYLQL